MLHLIKGKLSLNHELSDWEECWRGGDQALTAVDVRGWRVKATPGCAQAQDRRDNLRPSPEYPGLRANNCQLARCNDAKWRGEGSDEIFTQRQGLSVVKKPCKLLNEWSKATFTNVFSFNWRALTYLEFSVCCSYQVLLWHVDTKIQFYWCVEIWSLPGQWPSHV